MTAGLLAAALLAALLHGGRYVPPAEAPTIPNEGPGAPAPPTPPPRVVAEPGLGPLIGYDPERWEWWFEFHKEPLLDLRRRLAALPGYRPVSEEDRKSLVQPALLGALSDRRRDVRAAAVMALARVGSAALVPWIERRARSDRDLFVRTQALLALGVSGAPEAGPHLLEVYGDSDRSEEQRGYAAAGLALLGGTPARDAFARALDPRRLYRQNNQMRVATLYASGLSGVQQLSQPLQRLLRSPLARGDASARAQVAEALGRLGELTSLPTLLELLQADDNQVRRSAAMALQALAPDLDGATLAGLMAAYEKEGDVAVRYHLVVAFGLARRAQTRAWLTELYPTSRYRLRPWVALALGLDGERAHAGLLLESLSETHDSSARAAVALALGLLGAREAAAPLRELLDEQRDPHLAGYVALALGLLGDDDEALPGLLEQRLMRSHDVAFLPAAVVALGLLDERERLDRLAREASSGRSVSDRAALYYALGLVGDARTLQILLVRAADKADGQRPFGGLRVPGQHAYERAYLLGALGEMADPRPLPPASRLARFAEPNHDVGFLFELYRSL